MRNLRWHIIKKYLILFILLILLVYVISKFNRENVCFSFLLSVIIIILKKNLRKMRFIKIPLQWSRAAYLEKVETKFPQFPPPLRPAEI